MMIWKNVEGKCRGQPFQRRSCQWPCWTLFHRGETYRGKDVVVHVLNLCSGVLYEHRRSDLRPGVFSAVERPPVYSASDHVVTQRMWTQWWMEQILDPSGSHFLVHIVCSNDDGLSGHFVIRTFTIFAHGWHHQTTVTYWVSCVISGFCRLLWRNMGWYLPPFRDDLSTQAVQKESLTLECRTSRLSFKRR